MIQFIVKKNIYTGDILDVWQTRKQCAIDMGVTEAAISQAIKLKGKCKDYHFERIEFDKSKLLNILKNEEI